MATKFQFRLETVLRIRRHQEQLQKQSFAKVVQKKLALENKQHQVAEELSQYTGGEEHVIGRNHFEYIQSSQLALFNLKVRIKKVDDEIEIERKKLMEARQKTKALENLESKQRILFIRDLDKQEQIQMNEIATQRFNRERG